VVIVRRGAVIVQIKVELAGLQSAIKDLGAVTGRVRAATELALTNAAEETRNNAVGGIMSGPKTGNVYTHRFWTDAQGRLRRGEERVPHQASAPGQYPANDEGNLAASVTIERDFTGSVAEVRVGTSLLYGMFQELGTSKMAARPWLLPSAEKAFESVIDNIKREVDRRGKGK
jgi:HK97 gp10 family phage protein